MATHELKKKYTRRIDREYRRILAEGAKSDGDNVEIIPFQMQIANDYLVMELFGLSQPELDDLEKKEYQELLNIAKKEANPL